jgi:hypothetical protein
MSKAEIARHLGFSTRWVEMQVAAGCPSELWGNQRRFQASAVEQWLRSKSA